MRRVQGFLALGAMLLLAACAATTEVNSTWQVKTGEDKPAFNHIYVLSLANNPVNAAAVENAVKESLGKRAVMATLGHETLPADVDKAKNFRAEVEKSVRASGADGVLVVSLLKIDERDEYVPPQVDYVPMTAAPMYLGYGPYVGYNYNAIYQPGYYQNTRDYYLQSQLYSVQTGKPVWMAQSKVMNPVNVEKGAKGYASTLVRQLDKDGALKLKR
ncbi:hypothetical protein A11A3_13735 [Alcanivorax hongdengensis A-11-3]|uniref:Lipoprotein n=1 Tax=Alcanivorax hongdengensis A-11-3 TaxID=1177179 RepID=L0W9L1_9GAMM|nr:hypothetical protein [Alcanivorax hongdengensis]EKF73418.1 hypothetical protein A11A3_13735 [Alcanivorax hongdengensis A-11-3]